MYDTIEIVSPKMPEKIIHMIRNKVDYLQKIDGETGELMWQITSTELEGSFDARLSIRIWSDTRIKISGSVHKFLLGHNVFGGPCDIKACCRYLVLLVQSRLGISLPLWHLWEASRVDITHTFNLGDQKKCYEYFEIIKKCSYPRREPDIRGHYIAWASKNTCIKFYHKGDEFRKHDYVRLKKAVDKVEGWTDEHLELLKEISQKLIRVEVEVRKRQMKYDKINTSCGCLSDEYFNEVYHRELLKVMKEGESDMDIVRDIQSVRDRLYEFYPERKAKNLMKTWNSIQMEGVEKIKASVCRTTWYTYEKELTRVGISLEGNIDVRQKYYGDGLIAFDGRKAFNVYDFVPMPGNRFHVDGVFCDINKAILQLEVGA